MRKAAAAAKFAAPSTFKCALLGLAGMIGLLITMVGPFKVPFAESLAKTYYRQAVLGLVLMVALIAGVATAVVKLFDPNQFKDQLVRWVHERTQRDLVLDGELRVGYFPKLTLESGKASLSQRRSAREFASIDKARVTIAWLPLLRGRLHFDSAEVDGLRAQLLRTKDGSTNVDDLVHDVVAVESAAIDLDSLRLTRASLQWSDEIAWQRGSLSELQVDLGRLADGVASPLVASGRVDAPAAGIDARLKLQGRLLFDAAAGRIELARIDAALDGQALGIDNLTLHMKGDLTAWPRERTLGADNIVVSSRHKSGLALVDGVLSVPELKWSEYRLRGAAASFEGSLAHPDRSATVMLKVPRFEWAERGLRDTTVQAQVTFARGAAQLRAQGGGPLALVLEGGPRLELPALQASAQFRAPALATDVTAQLDGRVEVDLRQHRALANLTGQVAGSDAKLDLTTVDYAGRARWMVNADLARLDADAWLPGGWLARLADDATPFDPSPLGGMQVQGRVRVGELKLGGTTLRSAVAHFDLRDSVLAVEPVVAQLHGADIEAGLRIDAADALPQVSLSGSVSDLDLRGLLADVAGTPWLAGRGTLGWDLSARGSSVGALRHALAGAVHASVKAGALSGVDLRAALLEGKDNIGKPNVVATPREFDARASTAFSELRLNARVLEGRAHAQALEMQAGAVRTAGVGDLVLDTGTLDLRLQATVGPKVGAELAALSGVTVPLRVAGPWRAPQFVFDAGAASGGKVPRPGETSVASARAREHDDERAPVALSAR